MNKADLVNKLAKDMDIAKTKANKIVDAVFDNITKALKKGETASFIGFGNFSTKKRAAREGRNPATGQKMKIPAKTVPHFKAGAKLKKAVK